MGMTKGLALGLPLCRSTSCAVQDSLGAAACSKPVDSTRAGMDDGILHRVGGGLLSRVTGKLQALVMQAAEGHRGAVITIVSGNNPLCSLYSQAADNYGTQTTLQSTLSYVV